jgi:ATP-dependent Clp protease ATP-binding subunit ClpA
VASDDGAEVLRPRPPQMELTPRAREVLRLADRRANELGQQPLGVEHLLLAICEEPDSVAATVLDQMAARGTLHTRLLEVLNDPGYRTKTRRVADSEGNLLGHFETDERGGDVFVDRDGVRRRWPDGGTRSG